MQWWAIIGDHFYYNGISYECFNITLISNGIIAESKSEPEMEHSLSITFQQTQKL